MPPLKWNGAVLCLVVLCGTTQLVAQNPSTLVSVDAGSNRRPINPAIYGIAYGDAHDMAALNAPLNRWGGNSTTRYNWQIDAHSAGSDWYFETYPDGGGAPGGSADAYVATTRSATNGAEPMFTIPMIDYLANLGANRSTLEGFSVQKYGAQQSTDPWNPDAGNGVSASTGKNITGNDPLDTGTANSTAIQQGWVQHFVTELGAATTSTGIKYYILDNEPSLWYSTHRDVHPSPSTYQEMYNKIIAYASAIRAADRAAKIAGFEEWSWWAMYFSGFDQANGSSAATSDYNTHGETYYYPWLLQQLYQYKLRTGTQLLDILTVHCYNATPDASDDSLTAQQTRNRETRILWDPNYQDPSWYGDIGINGRVLNWIPTLKAMVNQYYPGLEIGCTEYNWGDEANLNGATTQADVLGIYGREGLDLATRWTVAKNTNTSPVTYYVTYLASQIYRNYDGKNSTFGDTSVAASVANPDNLSAFAAERTADGALTIMVINKQQGNTPVTVSLANFPSGGTAQVWQINSVSQASIARLSDVAVANNSISTTVPSQSITLLVIPAGSIITPAAPAGLQATAGNGQVSLTWMAASGAASYSVYRGTAAGAEATAAIAAGITVTSYTDTGLTNGTWYFYKVAAVNAGGTSPLSNEATATAGGVQSTPAVSNLQPAFGSGTAAQTFTYQFSDPAGWQNLSVANVLVNNVLDGRHACYLAYVVASSTLVLVDDAGDAAGPYAGSVTTGNPGTVIQNSQCAVNLTSAAGSGTTLTLTLSIAFKQAFAGNHIQFLAARDIAQNNSNWQAIGVWQVPAAASGTIAVSGMSPQRSAIPAGTAQAFTLSLTDSQGANDIGIVNLLVNNFIDGRQGCYLAYVASSNTLLLVDDAGDAGGPFAGSMTLNGSAGSIHNSQCTVSATGSSAAAAGNILTLTLNIAFQSGFGGDHILYAAGRDGSGANNTGWQAIGTVTVQ